MLLIFDLDGTLVDSIHDLAEAASDLSAAYGGPPLDDDIVTLMIGDGAPVLVQRILARLGQDPPPQGALEKFLAFYERRMFDTTRPYPGVIDLLRALVDSHALALLTNKPETSSRRILQHTGLDGFFPHMVFGDDASGRKPAPDGLRWLMERNGASPERTMLIGDSDVDVATARAAGVRLCLARYGFGFLRVDPRSLCKDDILMDQPSDLLAALNAQ